MRKIIIPFLIYLLTAGLSTGCSVYKIDVQQGNTLDQESLAQLKTGMTRQQVKFLLGTALVQDPFHPNRWDYAYTYTPGGGDMNRQHLSLYFKGDILSKIDKKQLTGYVRPKDSFKTPKTR